jgi:AcrR family transcriptional regulator
MKRRGIGMSADELKAEPRLPKRDTLPATSAKERLLDAAYKLFTHQGVGQVGVDTILAESGCAKASLYRNFKSKVDLAVAVLDRREQIWTRDWLETEIKARHEEPRARLLAIFDVFDGWFRETGFEGCSFINILLESEPGSPLREAAAVHLAKIRAMVRALADEAGLADVDEFAQAWHMLMKGSIVAAGEGNQEAAREGKRAAQLVIDGWPKRSPM